MSFSVRQIALFFCLLGTFFFIGCEKEESSDANNTGAYDCVSGDCVSSGKSGTYSSLSACQNACGGAGNAETYDCINGDCVGAGDNGTYGNLSSCQNSCSGVAQYEDQRDGEVYQLVEINGRIWMAENMRYGTANGAANGTWMYNDDPSFFEISGLGFLYSFNAANQACPPGWRLPLKEEVEEMINYLGGANEASIAMKVGPPPISNAPDWTNWGDPPSGSTYNTSGFKALPAGMHYTVNGYFDKLGERAEYWTASESGINSGWSYNLSKYEEIVRMNNREAELGFSCRCILD